MNHIKSQYKSVVLAFFLLNNFLYGADTSSLAPYTGLNGSLWYDARTTQMKFNFDYNQYDLMLTQLLVPTTSVSPAINYTNDLVEVAVTVESTLNIPSSTSSANLYSSHGIDWESAHETHFVFDGMFSMPTLVVGGGGSATGAIEVGIFDDQDGVGISYSRVSGGSAAMNAFTRKAGVTTTLTLNGTGPTDYSKLNLYRIVVTDKATGAIRFEFFDEATNKWVTMHKITNAQSTLTGTQLRNLHLPVQARTSFRVPLPVSHGGIETISFYTSGFSVQTLGDTFETKYRAFSKSVTSTVGSAEAHLLTLRNNSTFNSKNNWIAIRIKDFIGYALTSNILTGIFKVYKNATVTGTSYTSVDANNSVMSTSIAGTYSSGTGTEAYSAIFNAGTGTILPFDADDVYILVNPGETLTITSQLPYNTAGTIFSAIRWTELF